ncbi:MAG: hypothetical protein HC938_17185 [Nitrospira sp.]|nr:hypothetical protein [Nitrospira sp.]
MIDHQGDPQKQQEPVRPRSPGEPNQEASPRRRHRLWHRLVQTKQQRPELPLSKGKGSLMQIGGTQQIREDVIAIEPHERVQINRCSQRHAGRRHEKCQASSHPIVQKAPRKDRECRHGTFHSHPGSPDGGTLTSGGQFPGIGGVGVQHRDE